MAKELKNKPLVEAILEIRWQLQEVSPSARIDPHYKILLARLFDRMQAEYPVHDQLPSASIPDELVGHVVQHRFRVAENSWPLVQIGPGIFAVNSTAEYRWEDFRPCVLGAVTRLYEAYPKAVDLKLTNVILRYIDAVSFDFATSNVFDFLKDKLKVKVELPPNLFENTNVEGKPDGFAWQCSFKCGRPTGRLSIRFASGRKAEEPVVVWETTVESAGDDLPGMPGAFEGWLDAAHDITDDWFFKLIAGELERRFSGE